MSVFIVVIKTLFLITFYVSNNVNFHTTSLQTSSTCFIASKTLVHRLNRVLNPVKHCCSCFKHLLNLINTRELFMIYNFTCIRLPCMHDTLQNPCSIFVHGVIRVFVLYNKHNNACRMCENMNTSALVRFAHSRVTLVKTRNKFHFSAHPSFILSYTLN